MGKAKWVILFGISVNFLPFAYWGIPKNMELFQKGTLYIGQDALCDPQNRLCAAMDDLCICRGTAEEETLADLKRYYQV